MGSMEHAKENEEISVEENGVGGELNDELVTIETSVDLPQGKIARLSKKIKEKKHIIVICCILFVMLVLGINFYSVCINVSAQKMIKDVNLQATEDLIGQIIQGDEITQEFATKNTMLIGFSLKYLTYGQQNNGTITVSVTDKKTGNEIFSQVQPLNEVADGQEKTYMFKNSFFCEKGDKFVIKIAADNLLPTDKLTLNKNGDSFSFTTYCGYHTFIKPVYLISLIGFIAFAGLMYYLVFIKRIKIEKIFVLTMTFFGVIYMFLIPPMAGPDDGSHLNTIYGYSNVLLGKTQERSGEEMLKRKVDQEYNGFDSRPSIDVFHSSLKNFFDLADTEEMVEGDTDGLDAPVYLFGPAIIGMTLGRLLHLGTVPLYFLTRSFSLAFFIIITYFGMKKMPFGKPILFAVSVLPITLQQSATFSYDVVVNGLAFFYIAYCLYVAFAKQKIKVVDIIALTVTAILLVGCKFGTYAVIILLCLIIPKSKFSSKKRHIFVMAVILVSSFVMFIIPLLSNTVPIKIGTDNQSAVKWASEEGYTLTMLLSDPIYTIKFIINTFVVKSDFYLSSLIGFLGWFTVKLSVVTTTIFVILLVMSTIYEKEEGYSLKVWHKSLISIIVFAVVGLTLVGLAINWTPASYDYIEGVQGRYFLPILPLFLLLFKTKNVQARNEFYRIPVYFTYIVHYFAIGEMMRQIF